jgi:hypothetical protein
MDEKFADHAADARIGETIHLVGEDIRQFAAIAQRVVDTLDAWLVGGIPSPMLSVSSDEMQTGKLVAPAMRQQVIPTLGVSDLASSLGIWIATQPGNGLEELVNTEALMAAFSAIGVRELEEAIAELAAEGYVHTSSGGHALPYIRPTVDLFATFDPLANIGNPLADSLLLVEQILRGLDTINVGQLHEQTGWPVRRFNPAIGLVIGHIDERRISNESQNQYPTRHFSLAAEDRVALKRYVANVSL